MRKKRESMKKLKRTDRILEKLGILKYSTQRKL